MTLNASGYSHVRLTVTDIDRSRAFYDAVFGLPVAIEVPADADEATKKEMWWVFGGVVYSLGENSLLGLRPVAPAGDRFDPDRVGLDHVSLAVGSRADLESVVTTLDEKGLPHEEIKDIGMMLILELRDPDNIALELAAPKS